MIEGRLLEASDPAPVMRLGSPRNFPWLFVADHAGNALPRRVGALGLSSKRLGEHIAIDIGVWALTAMIVEALGAEAIGQAYSRLLVDCNRRPGTPASMPEISDGWIVTGNLKLAPSEAQARIAEVFAPYHEAIGESIAQRRGEPGFALCAMHSFTRTMGGARRAVDIGIIHGPDATIADRLLAALEGACDLTVGRNVPYRIDFDGDHTLPVHAQAAGLAYVEIEVCQDLIGTPAGRERIAALLIPAVRAAAQRSRP
jgi:predicted N-formylglutamate amidohydrolase